MARLPKAMSGHHLHHQQAHRIFNGNFPRPLIDDFVPPSTIASPPSVMSSPSVVKRYTPRDPISLSMLFNLASMRAMHILVFVFMMFNHTNIRAMLILVFVFMLFNLTSTRAMLILAYEIVMIYVMVLI